MKLICITGIDGAGKTTLARNIVARLQRQGKRSTYLYGRTYPILSRFLMTLGRSVFLRRENIWREYPAYSANKKRLMTNPLFSNIYTLAVLIDYYLQIWIKLLVKSFGNEVLVLDRYIYDTVINDLAVHLCYSEEQTVRAIQRGLRFLPRPVLLALMDIPEEVAIRRKSDIPHIDYLRERRYLYLSLRRLAEIWIINGEKGPDNILEEALERIDRTYENELREPIG